MSGTDDQTVRQVAWVFDLNKCSGCQTCSIACKIHWTSEDGTGPMDVEPGLVKWLHLAGGYGHLRYWSLQWQPTPVDRAVRVNIERAVIPGE